MEPATGADLRHIEAWLFDLDNTLYPLSSGLAQAASDRITDFMVELTQLPRDEARALQKLYLAEYGLTLGGLLAHHDVDPRVFHARFHDLPLESLVPDRVLNTAIERLPGRMLVFTNSDRTHARRVLERLEMGGHFEAVFDIIAADFAPKPSRLAFNRLLAAHDLDARTSAFLDDVEANLETAAALGMTTVLVGEAAQTCVAPFVTFRTERLAEFLASARVREKS